MGKKIGVYLTDEAYEIYSRIPSKIRGAFLSALIVYTHKNGLEAEILSELLGLEVKNETHRQDAVHKVRG